MNDTNKFGCGERESHSPSLFVAQGELQTKSPPCALSRSGRAEFSYSSPWYHLAWKLTTFYKASTSHSIGTAQSSLLLSPSCKSPANFMLVNYPGYRKIRSGTLAMPCPVITE